MVQTKKPQTPQIKEEQYQQQQYQQQTSSKQEEEGFIELIGQLREEKYREEER